jgi:hypothetical protein
LNVPFYTLSRSVRLISAEKGIAGKVYCAYISFLEWTILSGYHNLNR